MIYLALLISVMYYWKIIDELLLFVVCFIKVLFIKCLWNFKVSLIMKC